MAKLTLCLNSISGDVKNNQIELSLERLRTNLHSYKATREQKFVALTDIPKYAESAKHIISAQEILME